MKILISLLFLLSFSVHADLETFCAEIQKYQHENHLSKKEILLDVMNASYRPSTFGTPDKIRSLRGNDKAARNIIFTLNSPLEEPALKNEKNDLKILNKEIRKKYKLIKKAVQGRSAQDCAAYLKAKDFSEDSFNNLLTQRNSLFDAKIAVEARLIKSILPHRFLKEKWELKTTTHVDDILQVLQSKSVTNVIIVTHATVQGQLFDSFGNILPQNIFDRSSNVNSLAIYSCHSSQVLKFYNLEKNQIKNLFIAKESEYLGESGVAPLQTAGHFIRKIDRAIYELGAISLVEIEKECSINVSGITATKTDFGIFINTQYVGTLKKNENQKQLKVSCQDLSLDSTIGIRSLSGISSAGRLKALDAKIDFIIEKLVHPTQLSLAKDPQGEISVIKARTI